MSSYNFSIEFVYETQTMLITPPPLSMSSLQGKVHSLLSLSNVVFKYMDEEGDLITISTDEELLESYQIVLELQVPIFKILIVPSADSRVFSNYTDLKASEDCISAEKTLVRARIDKTIGYDRAYEPVWTGVVCDVCNDSPITGPRFKCKECPNFDLCEFCEMTAQHPHLFFKLTSLDQAIDITKVSLNNPGKSKTGATVVRKPKMKFLQHVSYVEGEKVLPGTVMEKIWKLKNCGNEEWPAGCRVVCAKGDLSGVGYELGAVSSGECIDAIASINIPKSEGRYTGVWKLVTPDGVGFGDKLYVIVQALCTEETPEAQIAYILGFGFDRASAIRALKIYPKNLKAAIKYLVNN